MPDWQPNWSDVTFDHDAAAEAAEACEAAARSIDGIIDDLLASVPAAQADWTGRARTTFDEEEADLRADMGGTMADLRLLAAAILSGAEAAADEQRARVEARERWRDERDAELAEERRDAV